MRGPNVLREVLEEKVKLSIKLVLTVLSITILAACGSSEADIDQTPSTDQLLHPSAINQPNIQPTENLKLLVPLYVDPINNRADWIKVANAADRVTMNVIVNPVSYTHLTLPTTPYV